MDAVVDAIAAIDNDEAPDRETLKRAVRELLQALAEKAPGHTVEVRVPPYGAVQCVEGPRHRRGTPPNVVECQPLVFLALATGRTAWHEALAAGRIAASGQRADLGDLLPLTAPTGGPLDEDDDAAAASLFIPYYLCEYEPPRCRSTGAESQIL